MNRRQDFFGEMFCAAHDIDTQHNNGRIDVHAECEIIWTTHYQSIASLERQDFDFRPGDPKQIRRLVSSWKRNGKYIKNIHDKSLPDRTPPWCCITDLSSGLVDPKRCACEQGNSETHERLWNIEFSFRKRVFTTRSVWMSAKILQHGDVCFAFDFKIRLDHSASWNRSRSRVQDYLSNVCRYFRSLHTQKHGD